MWDACRNGPNHSVGRNDGGETERRRIQTAEREIARQEEEDRQYGSMGRGLVKAGPRENT
jgi:hypothetical protein